MSVLSFSSGDSRRLDGLLDRAERNLQALELFSGYLNLCPRFITLDDVQGLAKDCRLSTRDAYRLLCAAACGLDEEAESEDQDMERDYFRPGIHELDPAECRADPYYQTIRLPNVQKNGWRMGYRRIEPCEAFTADNLLLLPDGREVPQLGYFLEAFDAPMVEQDGREWMTVTPSERNTMLGDIAAARGNVAVFGLGLGYYAFMVSQKPEVARITVIERDPAVIALFREYILPQFPNRQKITLVQADAYDYAAHMQGFDTAYVDIWHDVLDGVEMYLKMKRLEPASPQTRFLYWIEPSMLAWLRGMALMEIAENKTGPMLQTIGPVRDYDDLCEKLSQDGIRRIAARIPLEIARR